MCSVYRVNINPLTIIMELDRALRKLDLWKKIEQSFFSKFTPKILAEALIPTKKRKKSLSACGGKYIIFCEDA